ncbi:MAG: hypothetical protein WA902_10700 [Thermosynechococcaceae cyanobacterium]
MKIMMVFVEIANLIGIAMTAPAWAQEMQRSRLGNTVISQRSRHFNPATVETISGKVVRVDQRESQGRMSGMGIHVSVETAQETVDVHLGPSWYLNNQKLSFKIGDQVDVTGSRVADASQPTLIAAEVQSGNTVMTLRDENGLPVWGRRGQGRRMGRNRGMSRGQWRGAQ